jgi:hypothetical protein
MNNFPKASFAGVCENKSKAKKSFPCHFEAEIREMLENHANDSNFG